MVDYAKEILKTCPFTHIAQDNLRRIYAKVFLGSKGYSQVYYESKLLVYISPKQGGKTQTQAGTHTLTYSCQSV